MVWDGQAHVPWVTHDVLWTLDLGTDRVAWPLGNPGYSNSKTPDDLSSPFLKWVKGVHRGQSVCPQVITRCTG